MSSPATLQLVSHSLCPVCAPRGRAMSIEKHAPFEARYIDRIRQGARAPGGAV